MFPKVIFMPSRPWMPLYVGDYLAKTGHLTTLQHGMYLLLIMHYWANGCLPDSDVGIRKVVRTSPQLWQRNKKVLAAFFTPDWRHPRIEKELERTEIIRTKRKLAGMKGGLHSRGRTNAQRHYEAIVAKQMGNYPQSHIRIVADDDE